MPESAPMASHKYPFTKGKVQYIELIEKPPAMSPKPILLISSETELDDAPKTNVNTGIRNSSKAKIDVVVK